MARRFLASGFGAHSLVLIGIGLSVYFSAIFHPFVHDDVVFILQNPNIARWDNITDAFFRPSIPQIFEGLVTPYYRPVLEVLYRFQHAIFGLNPHGFHLFNVLVHIANTMLVYWLIDGLMRNRAWAFAASVIFLVHPVQTQAVACVSGVSNLACAFFMLIALNAYVRSSQSEHNARRFWFLVVAVFGFTLSLFSKEQAVVFPFLCLAYEFLNTDRRSLSRSAGRLLAVILPLVVYFVVRFSLFGSFASAIFENAGELKLRLLAIPGTVLMYAGLVVWPADLHYYRSIDILAPFMRSWGIFALACIFILVLLRALKGQDRQWSCFGLFWFLIGLAPVLNIIPLVNEYSYVAAAEHNLYVPLIGVLIFGCGVVNQQIASLDAIKRVFLILFFMVLVIGLGSASVRQNHFWHNEITLFKRALEFQPQLGRVHILLGKAYFQAGRMDEAIAEFDLAGDIMDRYARKASTPKARRFYDGMLKGIYADSAQAYAFKRDFRSSVARYDKVLALDPHDSHMYSNRALSLIGLGDIDAGMKDLEQALALDPDNLLAANNLSICYIQKGNVDKAREMLTFILSKDPGFKAARDNLDELNRSQPRQ